MEIIEQKVEDEVTDLVAEENIKIIQNYRIVKSNRLINCKSNFTAIENRIILLAIVQIKPTDHRLQMYKVCVPDILGKNSKTKYKVVREAVRRLHQSAIELEEGNKWKSYAFIAKAQGEIGVNFIEIQFHEDIQKFLLGLKGCYTSYKLKYVLGFKGNYSIRIYELCRQCQPIGFRIFEVDKLKEMLSLEKKTAYKDFSKFRNRVLDPACKEINETSDLKVSYKEIKEGRKVVKLRFAIEEKNPRNLSMPIAEFHVSIENKEKFEKIGFDKTDYFDLEKQYTIEKMTGVLALYEKSSDKIKEPKAWILAALKNAYIDKDAYRKFDHKEDKRKKNYDVFWKKFGIKVSVKELQSKISHIEKDLDNYKSTGDFKSFDAFQFLDDYTVEKVIEELEKEKENCYNQVLAKEQEIAELESEAAEL